MRLFILFVESIAKVIIALVFGCIVLLTVLGLGIIPGVLTTGCTDGAVRLEPDRLTTGFYTAPDNSTRTQTTHAVGPKDSPGSSQTISHSSDVGDFWIPRLMVLASLLKDIILGGMGYLIFRQFRLRWTPPTQPCNPPNT